MGHWWRVSDEQALTVECPLCGAVPGDRCIYAPLPFPMDELKARYNDRYRAKHERVGTPTQRVHTPRRNLFFARAERQWRQAHQAPVIPASPELLAATAAMRSWDYAEYVQLRAWLQRYGSIFELPADE